VLDRQQGDNAWLTMSLTEGKNREIRKVCAFFGWTVSRLIRLSYGPFQLGYLDKGEFEEVPAKVLRDQLGNSGAAQPLRPHQASGGKARPPKQKPEDRRTKRPDAERQEPGASPRAGADDRRQTSGRRNAVHKPQHQAERREDFNRGRRPDTQHPEEKRHGGKRQDERRAAYRGPTQSAETLGASLRQALDRASRDELAEEQQNRTARPNRAIGGKPSPTAGAEKNKRTFSGKNVPQDKPGAKKPGVKKPDAQKTRAAGRSHADRQPAAAGAKSDSGRQKHPGDQRSGRADSKPANRNGKHAHRQRRP